MVTVASAPPVPVRKSLRILYADDMRELRDLVQLGLTRCGHTVESVSDGIQALEKISADPKAFDLVISDHHMPKLNGLGFAKRLRELLYPGKIAIFSSELAPEVTEQYKMLKVDRILFKPVDLSTLRKLVNEI